MPTMFKRLLVAASVVFAALIGFTATALAAGPAPAGDGTLLEQLRPVFDAVKNGQWALGGSLAVVLLMALAKKYLPDSWGGKFVRGDGLGGVASTFALSFAGSLAIALAPTGATVSMAMAVAAAKFAFGAIGGYVAVHKLGSWLVGTAWFQDKAPAWLKTGVALLLALIGSSAVKKAEAAGAKAVENKPAQGANAVVGEPTEV